MLFGDLQCEYGLSYLFILYDFVVVCLISDYVCVMKDGRFVEVVFLEEIFMNLCDFYMWCLFVLIFGNEFNIVF